MDRDKIINILISGGILAFPTDTVFGLGSLMNKKAVDAIYKAKERDFNKSLPMMCNNLEMIEDYAYVDENARKIINKFTPGPLTIVLNKKDSIDDIYTQGKKTIAIRIPDDNWILELISELNKPLLVTSANVSGQGSLLKWEDVYKCMNNKIDAIVCEDAKGAIASTIIDLTDDLKILREGPIKIEELMEVIK